MAKSSHALIGIAGVHYIVSELSRRGLVALPTIRNTAGYDVIVSNVEGTQYANIQVKSSSKRVSFFPMPPSNKINDHKTAFYALVRWLEKDQRYECFFLTGAEAKKAVQASEKLQKKNIMQGTRKKLFPCVYVGPRVEEKAETWKERWNNWLL